MTETDAGASGALHVGMTAEQCWQRVPGGSASYIVALLDAFELRADVEATAMSAWHRGPPPPDHTFSASVRSMGLPRYVLYRAWNRLSLPRPEWVVSGLDVVHATTWAIPPTRRPLVVTVHDVAFLRNAAHFTPRGVRFFTRALERVRDEAAAVVVPSQATAQDVIAAGVAAERVHVVPQGVHQWTVLPQEITDLRARLRLPERFILWCGTFEPRKNLGGLLRAFGLAAAEDAELHLVLVGPQGWGTAFDDIQFGGWASRVHHAGRLSNADLRVAYAAATAFCFPSTWEGFGLPVLEAMSAGSPVITSSGTSMAEIVGDAGILVAPDDPTAIASGMLRAIGPEHDALAEAGRDRSALFSWDRTAELTLQVYQQVTGLRADRPARPTPG